MWKRPSSGTYRLGEHFERITGHGVASVYIAEDDDRLIALCFQRGKAFRELSKVEQALLKYSSRNMVRIVYAQSPMPVLV
jgi:hypothetical protein